MKLTPPQKLKDIAGIINAEFEGVPDHIISGINEIHKVEPGDLIFVDHPKYYDRAINSVATTMLIDKKVECPKNKALIISDDPFRDFNILTIHFRPFEKSDAVISDSAVIGEGTIIQPHIFIGNNVKIGENCIIHANVSIYDFTEIGNNVIIHANAVIGSDAFYFQKRSGGYDKLHSCGKVIIEDNVEIGACCTIDRGVSGNTVIGAGSILDNQIQIGHDTVIGKNCLFAAQVGVSGAVTIEDDVTLWGQVGIPSGLTIGKGAVLLGQSAPIRSLEGNKTYLGSPAGEAREKMKDLVMIRKIPEIIEKLK